MGGRGHASFFAMTVSGWLLFLKNPDSPGKIFLVYGCANTSLDKLPFALAKHNNVNTLSPSQLLATNEAATRRSFGLWMCKRELEQIPFCTCQSPNPISLSSCKLLATKKRHCSISSARGQKLDSLVQNCTNTNCVFSTAHVHCTHSARTGVHATVHATGHKML